MHFLLSKGSAVGRRNQWSDLLAAILVCYPLCICAIGLCRVRIKRMGKITHIIINEGKFVSWLCTIYERIRRWR